MQHRFLWHGAVVLVQLGCGGQTNTHHDPLTDATEVATGAAHTCAVVAGGVRCWGANYEGELGNGSNHRGLGPFMEPAPVQVVGLTSGVTTISAGASHTCTVVTGGVQCWGTNGYGQLGNGSTTDSWSPAQVLTLTSDVSDVAAGDSHTCAIVNGAVQCWGDNLSGILGDAASFDPIVSPVQIQNLTMPPALPLAGTLAVRLLILACNAGGTI